MIDEKTLDEILDNIVFDFSYAINLANPIHRKRTKARLQKEGILEPEELQEAERIVNGIVNSDKIEIEEKQETSLEKAKWLRFQIVSNGAYYKKLSAKEWDDISKMMEAFEQAIEELEKKVEK